LLGSGMPSRRRMVRSVPGAISLWCGTADGARLGARDLVWRDEGDVEGVAWAVAVARLSCVMRVEPVDDDEEDRTKPSAVI
jgi:hypothetical protein